MQNDNNNEFYYDPIINVNPYWTPPAADQPKGGPPPPPIGDAPTQAPSLLLGIATVLSITGISFAALYQLCCRGHSGNEDWMRGRIYATMDSTINKEQDDNMISDDELFGTAPSAPPQGQHQLTIN